MPGWVVLDIVVLVLTAAGHIALWAGTYNRLHATALPKRGIKLISTSLHLVALAVGLAFLSWFLAGGRWTTSWSGEWKPIDAARWAYTASGLMVAIGPLAIWAGHRLFDRPPRQLLRRDVEVFDVAAALGRQPIAGSIARLLSFVPGNDLFRVHFERKEIALPRLATELDGLTIAHLSDLHFCGRVDRSFFDRVIERMNEWQPDLIAVTGDLFDDRACFDWIDSTLARLRAKHGVYYILGNHDRYLGNTAALRERLTAAGLIDVGGKWRPIDVCGRRIILAGNELPWLEPAAALDTCPPRDERGEPLRILLSHSPDQWDWARRHDVDLMLAGHCHGGQVRLPLIGPLLVPSRLPVRYSAGLFYRQPTLLHVTRGLSAKTPLRVNCPPELSLLTLRTAK